MWKVAEELIQSPIIGQRVLESLGCDNKKMLATLCDLYQGKISVKREIEEDGNLDEEDTQIAALFDDSIFPKDGQIEDEGLEDRDLFVELANDSQEAINEELKPVSLKRDRKGYLRKVCSIHDES